MNARRVQHVQRAQHVQHAHRVHRVHHVHHPDQTHQPNQTHQLHQTHRLPKPSVFDEEKASWPGLIRADARDGELSWPSYSPRRARNHTGRGAGVVYR